MKKNVSPAVVAVVVVALVVVLGYVGFKMMVPQRTPSPSPEEMQKLIEKRMQGGQGYSTQGPPPGKSKQ